MPLDQGAMGPAFRDGARNCAAVGGGTGDGRAQGHGGDGRGAATHGRYDYGARGLSRHTVGLAALVDSALEP